MASHNDASFINADLGNMLGVNFGVFRAEEDFASNSNKLSLDFAIRRTRSKV
jgi:hypothetical protein